IHRPVEWSIWALPSTELERIYKQLSEVTFNKEERNKSLAVYNIGIYKNLVQVQIKNWWREAVERENIGEVELEKLSEEQAEQVLLKKLGDYIYLHFNEGEDQKKKRLQQVSGK